MLTINEIKKQYPSDLHSFDRGLLREYLQYQILGIIFAHPLGRKLSFLGGTCLRIVYKSKRFSEDLDFDNKGLSIEEFDQLGKIVEKGLERLGYKVQIKTCTKTAFHCYIKFPELLHTYGLSPLESEKILIQLDTFDQGYDYKTEIFILDKFDLFDQIIVTPKEVILSQKLWTITQRKRYKGRDFYDIMFLLQNTRPDSGFLKSKFGTEDVEEVKDMILDELKNADWHKIVADVSPFLMDRADAVRVRLFPDFLKQVSLS